MVAKRKGKCVNRDDYIHCEVEGAVINIKEGLHSMAGEKVTHVEILPDGHFAGERMWKVTPKVYNIRIVQMKKVFKP